MAIAAFILITIAAVVYLLTLDTTDDNDPRTLEEINDDMF